MFFEALNFLAHELNAYLDDKLQPALEPRVKLGNIARAFDTGTSPEDALNDSVVLSLVNVEEDRAMRPHESVIRENGTARYKKPPLLVNLYVLVSVFKDDYRDALGLLGNVAQFFQFQNAFTPTSHPQLDTRIEKLLVELYTLNFEQINHLWSTLGGKYLPSLLYKVQQLRIDERAVVSEAGLIQDVTVSASHL